MKPATSVRLDPYLVEEARKAGIPLSELFEAALAKVLKDKKCPYCGQRRKPKWIKK